MATDFDQIKALREEIAGLGEVQKAIMVRERRAERDAVEAEAELIAVRKLSGLVAGELERKFLVLRRLEAEKEKEQGQ